MSASMPPSPQPANTSPYDVAEHLRTREEIAAYLDAWLEDAPEDVSGFTRALCDIAHAKIMRQRTIDAGPIQLNKNKGEQ